MDPMFELRLSWPRKGSRTSAQSLFDQLRQAIGDGRLAPGAQMPATRQSPTVFGVSRQTCAKVYEKLLNVGYLTSRHGAGTFVAQRSPVGPAPGRRTGGADDRINPLWLSPEMSSAMGFWRESARGDASAAPITADFRPALVDSRLFPFDVYRRVGNQQLRNFERNPASLRSPQGNQGNRTLREAVTHHVAATRAIACRTDDVLVTSGAQQAFDLLARVLVRAGATIVAIEDPGYPPLRAPFIAAGAILVPVPVDDEGLVVDALPPGCRVICVTPSHQFPFGVAMSAARRQALLAYARAHGAVIVEDDYDGEFRYAGSPLEALKAADDADVVFYVGTFSKCLLPSLRLGFIIAPGWAMDALVAAKNALDWHCSTLLQATVAAFIVDGHLARHVRNMRDLYRPRRALLQHGLEDRLGRWLAPIPSFYGMHMTAVARDTLDLEEVALRMSRDGIRIHTLARYHLGAQTRTGLVFGYGVASPEQIKKGIENLRRVLSEG